MLQVARLFGARASTLRPKARTRRSAADVHQFRIRSYGEISKSLFLFQRAAIGRGKRQCAANMMNLKEAERERINKLEDFERKANVQLQRQLMMASEWSRALLTMRGRLKGTEGDPESSHCIDYSDFKRLLDSNNVQFMEYSNYGQAVSVILPYYKEGKTEGPQVDGNKEIIFRRLVVDRMPIDCWNDVCRKLHQQLVFVDVHNVKTVHAEVYSSVATAVVCSMRLALSVALYIWIDNMMRPIYAKLIPCGLGEPPKRRHCSHSSARPLGH